MKHLDLGCADKPRNPFNMNEVYGVDQSDAYLAFNVRQCQIGVEPLPYEANYFESVSAYDLLEHIPRQMIDYSSGKIRFPFIELMTDIHRVLKPQGIFLALTPAYPSKEAFQDPSHVNILTEDTHSYFCGETPHASRYGFGGRFDAISVFRAFPEELYGESISRAMKIKKVRYKILGRQPTHLVWKLRCIK